MVTNYNLEHELLLVYLTCWRTTLILFFDYKILVIYKNLFPNPSVNFKDGCTSLNFSEFSYVSDYFRHYATES